MNKELYVSSTPHETKVALVEDDQLAEIYFERANEYTLAGSIYKGRVTRVLPGMQSAFVDIGLERDAFLYVSDFLDLQDEEDEEFGDVKVTGQTLAQANGFVAAAPVEEEEAEEAEEEEGEPEGIAEGVAAPQTDEAGARRWRGRRRRRGRRGGRDRIAGAGENGGEAATDDTEQAPAADAQPDAELVEEDAPAEEFQAAEPEPDEIETPSAAPAAYTPILLPGESIARYSRPEGYTPEPVSEDAQTETREPRGRDRDRRGGRGDRFGRGRDRNRREREPREPRGPREPEAPLPANYTPILLPGESITKYRNIEPIATGDVSTINEQAENAAAEQETAAVAPETTGITQQDIQAPMLSETAAAVPTVVSGSESPQPGKGTGDDDEPTDASASHSDRPTIAFRREREQEPEEPKPSERDRERFHDMNVAAIFGGEATEDRDAELDPEEPATPPEPKPEADRKPEANTGQPAPGAVLTEAGEAKWSEPDVSMAEGLPAEEEDDEDARGERNARGSALADGDDVPTHEAGNYSPEGGQVVHEEIDEEESDMPALSEHVSQYHMHDLDEETIEPGDDFESRLGAAAGLIGEAVRDSGEDSALASAEYQVDSADEFEESEMLADDVEEEELDEADLAQEEAEQQQESSERRAPAPGTASHQRSERGFDRSRRDRGRREGGRPGRTPMRGGRPRREPRAIPLISDVLKEGQEILVQIAKEPIGKKGARITSHIALPGRFLVYMPTVNHIGVSRKINSEEERMRLKRIVASERENGHGGFIVRTAAANIREEDLRADIRFLKHLWHEIRTRSENSKSPALIYHDLNLVERILRDQVTQDFSQIWVDTEQEYERVVRFASRFQPSLVRRIKLYTKDTPLYEQFGIQDEINKSLKAKVWLKSGGYIVINQTEALVAVDINTGKYVGKTARLEDTIVKTNCDAIKEIVRQIRLRDLGGIIVIDFIDMDERKNRQKVMQTLEEALKADRAPSKVLQFNDFGLVAITRKRVKQSLERTLGSPCPYCTATGFVKSVATVCNEIYTEMRKIRNHIESKDVTLRVNPEVAKELKAQNGKWLTEMEDLIGHTILLKSDAAVHQEQFDINF